MLRFQGSCRACAVVMLALSTVFAAQAQAQPYPGIQGGVSIDPDQFFFGGHVETNPLVERVRFRPGIDIGLGDDVTVIALNFEFTYTFTPNRPWNVYAGGGPAVNWFDSDSDSDTEAGFNILVGVARRDGLFFELKVGAIDSPEVKFGVGYTFR